MSNTSSQLQAAQQANAITSIANVSRLLRDAISASIPVAPEQYLTVSVPGTSIDTRDISDGGTYVYSKEYSAFVPPAVRQAEGKLVDGMMPLAYVMVGNTGKSVSRSYTRALDYLVPRKATVKTGEQSIRSPGDATYDEAMKYLTNSDPDSRLTPVDIYIEKQAAWADAQSDWDKAKLRAQASAKTKFPSDLVLQRQDYDEWNQTNYRKYKFAVQGRYMDWVANGHKYEVEQNFGMIDVDSIMARIESSKESLRNSTIVDVDGANEIAGVYLEPKDWATKCKLKADGWWSRNGSYSIDQLNAEISRLQRLKISYQALSASITAGTYPVTSPVAPSPAQDAAVTALTAKFTAIYTAEANMNKASQHLATLDGDTAKDAYRTGNEYKGFETALNTARSDLKEAIDADTNNRAQWAKYNTVNLTDQNKASFQTYITGMIATIDAQVSGLQSKKDGLVGNTAVQIAVIDGAESDDQGHGTDIAGKGAELANPVFNQPNPGTGTSSAAPSGESSSNPWTTISVSFSAEDQQSTTTTSSWGMSVGGGAGWGLWSVGGSYAHDESRSDTVSDMAKCAVSVTFDALVVNINRPWLYGELFADYELDVASGVMLSPGAADLQKLMQSQKKAGDALSADQAVVDELAQYSSFPAYPTSFIIAADTVIEFQGETQHIENHFSSHSNSGSMSVGWGPFSVSSSFHESASSQSFQMQSTATGCRLSFGAPQIIGWVSEIIPALPRKANFAPMVQNVITV